NLNAAVQVIAEQFRLVLQHEVAEVLFGTQKAVRAAFGSRAEDRTVFYLVAGGAVFLLPPVERLAVEQNRPSPLGTFLSLVLVPLVGIISQQWSGQHEDGEAEPARLLWQQRQRELLKTNDPCRNPTCGTRSPDHPARRHGLATGAAA